MKYIGKGSSVSVTWSSALNSVEFYILSSIGRCLSVNIPEQYNFTLPSKAIYNDGTNNNLFYIRIMSNNSNNLDYAYFDSVTAVGLESTNISLSNLLPGYGTDINVTFTTVTTLPALDTTITIKLPGFKINDYPVWKQKRVAQLKSAGLLHEANVLFENNMGNTVSNSTSYQLTLQGPYKYTFNAIWKNISHDHTIEITPLYKLLPGTYTISIAQTNSTYIIGSPYGMSDLNPPTIAIKSTNMTISTTNIYNYPRILGLTRVSLRINVEDRVTNALRSLKLFANFSYPLSGSSGNS